MTEDVGTTPRKSLTPTQRLKMFENHKGICILCSTRINAGDLWIDEHIIPLGLGGTNEFDNRGPAHKACADAKTHGEAGDIATIAKAKRAKMKHLGISESRTPMPFGKKSPWKKKFDGTIVRRDQ